MVNQIIGNALTGRLGESHGDKSRVEYDNILCISRRKYIATKLCIDPHHVGKDDVDHPTFLSAYFLH